MTEIATDGTEGSRGQLVAASAKGDDAGVAKPDEGFLGWFKSFKYFAALTGVLAGIWALFPAFYLQGYLEKLGLPVSAFPVETIDASVALHRVMLSVLTNFLVLVPDHPVYATFGAVVALVFGISLWLMVRNKQGKGPVLPVPKWRPGAATVGLGGALWLAMMMYLLPRVVVAGLASLLLLPYVAEWAGIKDAEKALAKRSACATAPGKRTIECVSVRYEEKGLDGKEHVEQLDGVVVMGNGKLMAVLASDGEVRLIPAAVVRLSAQPPALLAK
jgi:hypothetical protein